MATQYDNTSSTRVILGIEASGDSASVALGRDGNVIAVARREAVHGHAAWITILVKDCLAEAQLCFNEIDLIAGGRGPGSFTGIRVALAAARGFGLALDIPVYGISSLAMLATSYHGGDEAVLAVVSTRRKTFFSQIFTATGASVTPQDMIESSLDELPQLYRQNGPLAVVGHCGDEAGARFNTAGIEVVASRNTDPDAVMAVKTAEKILINKGKPEDYRPEPCYVTEALTSTAKSDG